MFKKLFEHRIRKDANGYYCYLCKIPIKNEDVLNHCDSKNVSHNKFRQLIVNEFEKELQNLSDEKFEELIKNEIVQVNHGVYYCNVCDCIMPRLCHVIEHISGQRHVNKVFNKHDTSRNNSYFCSLCKIHLYCETNFKEHIFGRKHREKEELRLSKIDFYKPLPSLKESVSSSNNFLSQSSTISLPVQFTCFVCDSNFWYKEAMAEHIFKSKRDCKISSLLYLKELNDGNLIYHCTLCKVDLSYCSLDLIKHSQGKKHKLSVKDFKEKVRLNNMHVLPKNESVDQVQKGLDNLNLVSHSMDEKSKCSYRCYVCNVTVCGDVELLQHLHDLKHKHILSTLPRDYFPFIYCPACKKDIFEDKKMIDHLSTVEHENQLLYTSNKSLEQSNLSDCLPASKTIVDELCNQMIRKPKMDNKKHNRSTIHFNSEYSKIFLEEGPFNIFNATQEKINYLLLGVTLLLQVEEDNFCLVCCIKVPNSLQNIFEHLFSLNHTYKLEKLMDGDREFKNFPVQFSDLALAKEFMKEVNNDITFCFACNKDVINNDSIIKKHIDSEVNHLVKAQSQKQLNLEHFNTFLDQLNNCWYIVQRFSCQLCNMKSEYEIDFAEHLQSKKHSIQLKKMIKKGDKVSFDVCLPCASICYGNSDTYTKHCDNTMHKYLVKSKDYEVVEMNKSAVNLLNNFKEISESLLHQSDAATASEKHIRLLSKFIEQTVASQYPGARAYVFGSRAAHLAFNNSDVDVFLDCGNGYNGNQLLSKSREYLLNSEECFKNCPDMWEVKETLLKVRAPIIKVYHRELELNCDLSFTNGLTVEKTKIIKLFITSFPLCRKMILFLKKWLSTCLLTHEQGLTTFGITWLVIFYLQHIHIFPSIAELMKQKSKSIVIGDSRYHVYLTEELVLQWQEKMSCAGNTAEGISKDFDSGPSENATKIVPKYCGNEGHEYEVTMPFEHASGSTEKVGKMSKYYRNE